MSKVLINKELAKMIEKAKREWSMENNIVMDVLKQMYDKDIRELTKEQTMQIVKAVYDGYELEKEFNVGDLIECIENGSDKGKMYYISETVKPSSKYLSLAFIKTYQERFRVIAKAENLEKGVSGL